MVRRDDFVELKKVVADLAEAQKRSEERLGELIGEHRETREQYAQKIPPAVPEG